MIDGEGFSAERRLIDRDRITLEEPGVRRGNGITDSESYHVSRYQLAGGGNDFPLSHRVIP